MKIRVLSDLHLEFNPFTPDPVPEADLVIPAGDTDVKRKGVRWARDAFPDHEVLYLAGNHEYYGERFPGLIDNLRTDAIGSKIHILENDSIERQGCRFFGSTLWTDLALFGDVQRGSIDALEMNDYRKIRKSVTYRRLRPLDTRMRHAESLAALTAFLRDGDPRHSVIVTHHAPSPLSLKESRLTDPVSCAYCSRLDDLILEWQPLLWIHGHIHEVRRYKIGETTILANPRGYDEPAKNGFDPNLVVDLAGL